MDYSADDIESGDDDLYTEEGADLDYGFAEETWKPSQLISYVVLTEEDIRKQQRDDIEGLSTVLSISQAETIVLLLHYHWNVSKVEDEWFTDEERVRKSVGILKEPLVNLNERQRVDNIECGICFESYLQKEISTVSCGHPYCNTCWTGYITTKINDGPGCLRIKCPEPSCSAVVCQDTIDKVISKEDVKDKYYKYFVRSYVEASGKKIKWCPSPGCEHAIDFGRGSGSGDYDVSCLCSYDFCWNCGEAAHRPLDCETVSKWILKNTSESQNTAWILAYTKPCPNCKSPIEKNKGCDHMMCSICKHHFGWVDNTKFAIKRKNARKEIHRYMHYYERWGMHESSWLKSMADLKKLQSVQLKKLSVKQCTQESQLQFILDAWRQIIECRRVMKWTYAYGYYLPEQERTKKQFFEYLQGEAEVGLERLHHCAEVELEQFVCKSQDPSINFHDFRKKLTGLSQVTKTYFENLVKALENGLADVALSESKSTTKSKSCTKRRKLVKWYQVRSKCWSF